jgi:hypothetical protein
MYGFVRRAFAKSMGLDDQDLARPIIGIAQTHSDLNNCNNNFRGAEGPFPSKAPSASLNLSTYIALYNYGYRNVYELADTFELKTSRLEFESNPRG